MVSISRDGYIRITLEHLHTIKLDHLVSGLDEDPPLLAADGATTTAITGYTEFVSAGTPGLTLGWDWQMTVADGQVSLARVSPPRSNIMLQDGEAGDIGFAATATRLQEFVDALRWQQAAIQYVNFRYAK